MTNYEQDSGRNYDVISFKKNKDEMQVLNICIGLF